MSFGAVWAPSVEVGRQVVVSESGRLGHCWWVLDRVFPSDVIIDPAQPLVGGHEVAIGWPGVSESVFEFFVIGPEFLGALPALDLFVENLCVVSFDRLLLSELHGLFPADLAFGFGALFVDLTLAIFDGPGFSFAQERCEPIFDCA